MNPSKEYIQTSRFKINPHHSSGTLIIIEGAAEGSRRVEPTKPPRGVKIFTTESVEYYKALHQKMKKDEENWKKLIYSTSIFKPGQTVNVPVAKGDRRDGLRNNNTLEINGILLDNYVEFIPKK